MFKTKAHIILIDGKTEALRDMLCFELALTLLYNAQKTAIIIPSSSSLHQTISNRLKTLPQLLSPTILEEKDFYAEANKYNAIIIPYIPSTPEILISASTYITLINQNKKSIQNFQKDQTVLNNMWELKKKIAATYNQSLDWVVCEYNTQKALSDTPTPLLENFAKTHGFRLAPPLNNRNPYQNNIHGISAQDKFLPLFEKQLTYEDICAKREIIKLAEFVFC